MLDQCDVATLIEDTWAASNCPVELPDEWTDFFDCQGPTHLEVHNQRSYHRFYLRGKAVLERKGLIYPVYTKDVSRMGFGFYCGEQLFPCEFVLIRLPNDKSAELTITRCVRVQEHCYECGTHFINRLS